uniref:Uncharacterized protein n=1 Tax=viral metagenome TaxID=1070528 RepID=A0A6H1ZB06_9ZZZZ
MDTTPEYIKMCEKAEEIQLLKIKPIHIMQSEADILYEDNDVWYIYVVEKLKKGWLIKKTWLPRQDQLQEMISPEYLEEDKFMLLDRFLNFVDMSNRGWSFEQLWLAFVMQEKYGKIWTGEEWSAR